MSNSEKAVFYKAKWWLHLKSKSILWVNASILNPFETKLRIFTKHQYPSIFHIFDIILKKCCKQGLLNATFRVDFGWRKNANLASHFFVPNFLTHCMILNTNSFRVFFLAYQRLFVKYLLKPANDSSRQKKLNLHKKETFDASNVFPKRFMPKKTRILIK